MRCLAKALIAISKHMRTSQDVNVAVLISCANTVRKSIADVCKLQRENLRSLEWKLLDTGSAVTFDALTQKSFGRKYYDFVIHYVKQGAGQPPKLETQVLFLALSESVPDTGENIRRLLNDTFYSTMSIDFDLLMQSFTFVTDCAAVMPTVVGSSILTAR